MSNGVGGEQATMRQWRWFVGTAVVLGLVTADLPGAGSSPAWAFQEKKQDEKTAEEKPAAPEAGKAEQPPTETSAGTEEEPTGDNGYERESFLIVMARANGLFFGPLLLLLSFVMVALVMMNVLQVRRDNLLPPEFIETFEQRLTTKDYQGAYDIARNDDSFIGRVLAAGLSKLNRGYNEAIEGMQEVGEDENMALEHRISYLALIGSIAPMVGLMGTVWGMIGAFEEIATSPTQPKPKDLAQDIYTALFTTFEGLVIAIPAMIAYSMLRNRVARFVLEVGIVSEGLMNRFSAVGKGSQTKSVGGTTTSTAPAAPQE